MIGLAPDDRIILDRLLTQFATRLDGAIEFLDLGLPRKGYPSASRFPGSPY